MKDLIAKLHPTEITFLLKDGKLSLQEFYMQTLVHLLNEEVLHLSVDIVKRHEFEENVYFLSRGINFNSYVFQEFESLFNLNEYKVDKVVIHKTFESLSSENPFNWKKALVQSVHLNSLIDYKFQLSQQAVELNNELNFYLQKQEFQTSSYSNYFSFYKISEFRMDEKINFDIKMNLLTIGELFTNTKIIDFVFFQLITFVSKDKESDNRIKWGTMNNSVGY